MQVQFSPKLEEGAIEEEAKKLAQEKLLEEQREREKALAEEQRAAAEAMSNQPAGVSKELPVYVMPFHMSTGFFIILWYNI